jgi:hypothetical protein
MTQCCIVVFLPTHWLLLDAHLAERCQSWSVPNVRFVSRLLSDSPVVCVCFEWMDCRNRTFKSLSFICQPAVLRAVHSILVRSVTSDRLSANRKLPVEVRRSTHLWNACNSSVVDLRREITMFKSRGPIRFSLLFTAGDIGLSSNASVEHVIKAFLHTGEAIAARWIEMPKGILLLQEVPDQPASGAIYLYDREQRTFFFVDFVDGRDDDLTAPEFDRLVAEYDLVSWAANPQFVPFKAGTVATA